MKYSLVAFSIAGWVNNNPILSTITFDSIGKSEQEQIKKKVEVQCKKYVIGALYVDSGNLLYDFMLNGTGITLNPVIYEFLLKYKTEIEKLNDTETIKSKELLVELMRLNLEAFKINPSSTMDGAKSDMDILAKLKNIDLTSNPKS